MSAFTKFLKVFSAVCEILIILLGNCVFGDKPADPLCCRCTGVETLICLSPASLPFWTLFFSPPAIFGHFCFSELQKKNCPGLPGTTPADVTAMLVCVSKQKNPLVNN